MDLTDTLEPSYGIITLNAVELIRQQLSPTDAWYRAVSRKRKKAVLNQHSWAYACLAGLKIFHVGNIFHPVH